MDMNKEDAKAAFLILESAEQGRPVEFIAQNIASYIVSGELGADDIQEFVTSIIARTTQLIADVSEIWWTLLPGAAQGLDVPQFVVNEFTEGLGDPSEDLIGAINAGHKPSNVVLTYKLIVKPDAETSLYADGCEFFLDEHDVQWIKFVPHNGHDRQKEHMFRTDSIYAVVRDTR